MNNADVLAQMAAGTDIDSVLVANRYTLLDGIAEHRLLICNQKGIAAIAGGVFNSSLLAEPTAGAKFNYQPATAPLIERAQVLDGICGHHGIPLNAAALPFPLRYPTISPSSEVRDWSRSSKRMPAWLSLPIPDRLWGEIDRSSVLLR